MSYKALNEENCNDFPNFKYSEFACHCDGQYCNGYPVAFSYELAKNLQNIRDHFGRALVITSPIRCERWNEIQGGVSNSKHKQGWAADFYLNGVSYDEVYNYVRTLPYFNYAYRVKANQNVIHYDIIPPNEDIVQPVERNENVDQLKVNATNLRVRDGAGINANVLGFANTGGIYNYYQIYNNDDYEWYRIADNQWIANINLEIYPAKKEPTIDELKKKIQELTDANNLLIIANEEYKKINNELQEKINNIKEIVEN